MATLTEPHIFLTLPLSIKPKQNNLLKLVNNRFVQKYFPASSFFAR